MTVDYKNPSLGEYKELIRCSKDFMKLREEKEEYEVSKSYRLIIKDSRAKGINVSLVTRRK